MQAYSERRGTDYGGLTVYAEKRIYVSASVSVIHEFGHFLAWELGFPPEHDALYCAEQESARTVLRDYAVTNSQEYFADYFSFWIRKAVRNHLREGWAVWFRGARLVACPEPRARPVCRFQAKRGQGSAWPKTAPLGPVSP